MPDTQHTTPSIAQMATPVRTLENVTLEQFRDDILPHASPVLMKGFVRHWPAVRAGRGAPADTIAYLKRFDAGRPVETIHGAPQIAGRFFYNEDLSGLNFDRAPAQISASLDRLAESLALAEPPSTYIQSVPTPPNLPGFAEENTLSVLPPVIEPRIWIGNALTVQTHFDLYDNIACVVSGRRRFTLFPPDQTPNLYVGPFELTLSGPPVSMVRLEAPDYEAYPRVREAERHAQVAELEPGDAIYIPYFWWHHVQSLERFNVLVNYWWNDARRDLATPFDALLHAILALRDMPENQRGAWQTMFDHYVFQKNGDPVAHLPEQARSALGPHTPQMRGQLKAMLAQKLAHQAGLIPKQNR